MEKIIETVEALLKKQHFDCLAIAEIDFQDGTFDSICIQNKKLTKDKIYFDLASLTKPLTLAATYLLKPEIFDDNMKLLLNHRGGLPSWGRLDNNWTSQLLNYKIKKTDKDIYSDFSALRLMLEIEAKTNVPFYEFCSKYFDEEVLNWLELKDDFFCPETGTRNGNPISGQVHDDNAFVIGEKVSHAGLFGTIKGVSKSLLTLNQDNLLFDRMNEEFDKLDKNRRFIAGWDRVTDPSTSLAGPNASLRTFGHLGFTGTSIWIDLEKKKGSVVLSNATKNYWYDKDGLAEIRKEVGSLIF
jgi:CubicO group peptidase (beta-lactamase class C family)